MEREWVRPLGLALLVACGQHQRDSEVPRRSALDSTAIPATPAGHDVVDHLEKQGAGDPAIASIAGLLRDHVERPWTIERLAAATAAEGDIERRAALVYLLAASRDVLGLRVAGRALSDPDPEVAVSAASGIKTYWIGPLPADSSSEDLLRQAEAWWKQWLSEERQAGRGGVR